VLQPLHPEAIGGPRHGLASAPWLSHLLPPGPGRDQLHEIELDLRSGYYAEAVRRSVALFQQLTREPADPGPGEGNALRALAVGVPYSRYLRFREAARNAELGTATREDGLFALFFLLDAALPR
jgi:hypothetical protein